MAVSRPPRTTEGPALALCATDSTPCQWFSQLADLLDARSAPRLLRLFLGALLAAGRRTVTSWLRAAGITHDFRSAYTTVAAVVKHTDLMAVRLARSALQPMRTGTDRLQLGIDDTPTQRYGPEPDTPTEASSPCRCWLASTSARPPCRASLPKALSKRSLRGLIGVIAQAKPGEGG